MKATWRGAALIPLVVACGCRAAAIESAPASVAPNTVPLTRRTAAELLDRCVRYHDPHGNWPRAIFRLELKEERLSGVRHTTLIVNNRSGDFHCLTVVDDVPVVIFRKAGRLGARRRELAEAARGTTGHGAQTVATGSNSDLDSVELARIGLTPERIEARSRYYLHLIGVPMNLRAGAARVIPAATRERFADHEVDAIEVRDEATAAHERWVFCLDTETGALRGCRCLASADSTASEWMMFEGEIEVCGMRIPTTRRWFAATTNVGLGVDTIVAVQKLGD